MTRHARKVLSAFASLGWLWCVTSCDPNVVIGTKLHGIGSEGGTVMETSGSGGVSLPVAGTAGATAGSSDSGEGGASGDAAVAGAPGVAGEPAVPPLLFEATHSDGNLAEWDEGPDSDSGGYYSDPGVALPKFVKEPARSVGGAVQVTIDTSGGDRIARLYRRIEQADAYYSAWFYLGEDHDPSTWWSIFLYRAVKDRNKSIDLWSVDLLRRPDGSLTLGLFDHETSELINATVEPTVEVGKWFQLQAFLHQESGQPSQLTLYYNGVEFLRLDDATPAPPDEPMYWVIGNGAAKLDPTVSTLYIDDAAISTAFIR